MAENERSHSAVLMGTRAAIVASLDKLGNMSINDEFVQGCISICRMLKWEYMTS